MRQLRFVVIALCCASAACGASKPPPARTATVPESDSEAEAAPKEAEDERDPRNVVPALPIAPP